MNYWHFLDADNDYLDAWSDWQQIGVWEIQILNMVAGPFIGFIWINGRWQITIS